MATKFSRQALGLSSSRHTEAAQRDFEVAVNMIKLAHEQLAAGDCRAALRYSIAATANVAGARAHQTSAGATHLEATFLDVEKQAAQIQSAVEKRCMLTFPRERH